MTGPGWCERVFTFYDLPGAAALARTLEAFDGGRLVVNIADMPIKCPVAPIEFAFLADWYLRERGARARSEVVLATPVLRARWAVSHLVIAFGWSALALFAGGVGLGVPAAIATSDVGLLPRVAAASLAYVPAVWVLTAVAVALFGLLPRWTALAWAPLAVALVVGMFGTLLGLPRAVLDLSPFEPTPNVPAADWEAVPLVALLAVSAALVAVGLGAFRRRDIPA